MWRGQARCPPTMSVAHSLDVPGLTVSVFTSGLPAHPLAARLGDPRCPVAGRGGAQSRRCRRHAAGPGRRDEPRAPTGAGSRPTADADLSGVAHDHVRPGVVHLQRGRRPTLHVGRPRHPRRRAGGGRGGDGHGQVHLPPRRSTAWSRTSAAGLSPGPSRSTDARPRTTGPATWPTSSALSARTRWPASSPRRSKTSSPTPWRTSGSFRRHASPVEDAVDLLGLQDLRDRSLRAFSGGQQQRVAIGAVLTASPRLLVLDEPTSALDPAAAEEVLSAPRPPGARPRPDRRDGRAPAGASGAVR